MRLAAKGAGPTRMGVKYWLLLRFYPRSFREAYGDELVLHCEDFNGQVRNQLQVYWSFVQSGLGVRIDAVKNTLFRTEQRLWASASSDTNVRGGPSPHPSGMDDNMSTLPSGLNTFFGNLRHDFSSHAAQESDVHRSSSVDPGTWHRLECRCVQRCERNAVSATT